VYFEPINIRGTGGGGAGGSPMMRRETTMPVGENNSDRMHRLLMEKRASSEQADCIPSRSNSRQTVTSKVSSRSVPVHRQVVLLDKRAVLNRFNEEVGDDLDIIEGAESTGSLAIRPHSERSKDPRVTYNRDRICRGSVVHKLFVETKRGRRPALGVSGGKFVSPPVMSPLLRTQTQYSLSNHRLTTNSPDLYHLPPLEQFRASLRRMDNARGDDSYHRAHTQHFARPVMTDDLKPFIKYSPDIKAKFEQQTHLI
jgi:hypothetical protein